MPQDKNENRPSVILLHFMIDVAPWPPSTVVFLGSYDISALFGACAYISERVPLLEYWGTRSFVLVFFNNIYNIGAPAIFDYFSKRYFFCSRRMHQKSALI